MTRRSFLTAALGLGLGLGAASAAPLAVGRPNSGFAYAAPNPVRDRSIRAEVVLEADGSITCTIRETLEVVLAYEFALTAAFSDAFRLPDRPGDMFPRMLLPGLTSWAAERDGTALELEPTTSGHRIELRPPGRKLEPGTYETTLTHRWSGGSIATDDAVESYLQLGHPCHRVTVTGPGIRTVRRQRHPGIFTDLGEATADGWQLSGGGVLHTLQIVRDPIPIPEPRLITD